MIKKLWFVLISALLLLSLAHGRADQGDTNESNYPIISSILEPSKFPTNVTNWGPSDHGIRLAILATNTSFSTGSQGVLFAVMTNLSTNSVQVLWLGIDSAFHVRATNASGKSYFLTPAQASSRDFTTLNPGKELAWELAITFATNMEPGEYTVGCSGRFSIYANIRWLESNPLKLQVK